MALYGRVEYWNERYRSTSSESYDWYQTYGSLKDVLLNQVELFPTTKPNEQPVAAFPTRDACRVLILGCGNSPFAADMTQDGWRGPITNVDFSSEVIEQMSRKYGKDYCAKFHCPTMQFVCADVTKGLPFEDASFDLIICKGTFDSLLCSSGSVANAKFVVSECSRVLANGHGVLFLVSYANPDNRVVFLEYQNDLSYYWQSVGVHTAVRSTSCGQKKDYVYICRKRMDAVAIYRPRPMTGAMLDEENGVPDEKEESETGTTHSRNSSLVDGQPTSTDE